MTGTVSRRGHSTAVRAAVVAVAVAALLLDGPLGSASAAVNPPIPAPLDPGVVATASQFYGAAELGPLFPGGVGSFHSCTAVALNTTQRNLIMTAAHCVSGSGYGAEFAPGYFNGQAPLGIWTVDAAYVPAGWSNGQDPRYDYAVLAVSPVPGTGVTGPLKGVALGTTAATGQAVQVSGYTFNSDIPITCGTTVYGYAGFPALNCNGYGLGTSGSPWVATEGGQTVVSGVLGGLWQGGCYDNTSYAAPFDDVTVALVSRAVNPADYGDNVPAAGPTGC